MLAFARISFELTGPIPSLAGLSALNFFYVGGNRLIGPAPALPTPTNALYAGYSSLCPNLLDLTPSANDAGWHIRQLPR